MLSIEDCFEMPADEKNRSKIEGVLLNRYPFLSCSTIGYSRLNRPIKAFRLGNEHNCVLFCGAIHAMEWITAQLMYKYINEICCSIMKGRSIAGMKISRFLNSRGLIIIPCANPDGVEIQINGSKTAGEYSSLVERVSGGNTKKWQANAAGIDLNHNFSAGWQQVHEQEQQQGIVGPAPTRYGGKKPESEPETRTLTCFCRKNPIRHMLAFHSQGEEIYWEFGKNTPVRSKLMADIMGRSSGYTVATPQGIAYGAGFKDWFIDELKKPGFTIEVGKGENPLPISDLNSIYTTLEEMLTLSVIM